MVHLQTHIKTVHLKESNYICQICNKSFWTFNHHLQKHILNIHINPKPASMSRLEHEMFKILTDLNINFQREKTFEDLRGLENGYLRFDFAIPTSNDNTPYLLIEVDGIQHNQPVHFAGILMTMKLFVNSK